MTEPIIVTEQLTRRFGETLAVDGLTLTIQPGEVFGFLGHNGAGKTTTVRLLNGVLTPSAGTIRVMGLDPVTQGPQVRHHTGVLTETPALDDRLTACESLRFYANLYGVPVERVNHRVDLLLDSFGLGERADAKISSYSKGMRQRLALARTLIHDPAILFLDEPTSGLDPSAARDVHQRITQLSRERGRTVFLCTHNLVEAQRLCDRVAVLARGRLLALGTPAELTKQFGNSQRVQLVVGSEQVEHALALLGSLPGVANAQRLNHGSGAIAVQGVARQAIPHLIGVLVNAAISIYSVVPAEPTLEEVYFALQTNATAGHGLENA